mmetsp:Transcript_44780/g.74291  ORF Transcript_44780/g.74291 Transcript_44780/m.74291 type:complete len:288 (-) Transcript_44780:214-1077(-)|eukprot:CAMPEP_0119312402 /NCGR_PEP_ID=MMETSP1333-20130426/26289_1 /TAXON_ID=418940 /ORGANISM="Scyphosphaera apsteinii, Strain RCC1455" /LENGTH=287 /DNA_ID=CAMNT_0007317015 /DNA_START=34 /DNA_END=897 /DNA_ORIENTATION=-
MAMVFALGATTALIRNPLPHVRYAANLRSSALQLQQGPLEEGYRELLPMLETAEGNVDPELVNRMNLEVQQLTGVNLEGLLNPSKVVNLERERVLLEAQLAECTYADEREQLDAKLSKVETDLYREKRTVFRGWLKNLFVGQAVIATVLTGFMVFDAFPWFTLDISLRALGFWSFWLFIIPSLRARRPTGREKKALNVAFLGSPILTLAMPFVTKDPANIWLANLIFLAGSYVYGYAGDDNDEAGSFTGILRWLDFGSGQERGMRAGQREAVKQRAAGSEVATKDLS